MLHYNAPVYLADRPRSAVDRWFCLLSDRPTVWVNQRSIADLPSIAGRSARCTGALRGGKFSNIYLCVAGAASGALLCVFLDIGLDRIRNFQSYTLTLNLNSLAVLCAVLLSSSFFWAYPFGVLGLRRTHTQVQKINAIFIGHTLENEVCRSSQVNYSQIVLFRILQ